MRITFPAVAACTLSITSLAQGASPPERSTAPLQVIPQALQSAVHHRMQIINRFPAASGLTGWVLREPDGKYALVYTTADGQTLLVGELLSSGGQSLSEQYEERYVPPPDLTALWGKLEKANIVIGGKKEGSKSTIYVVMDPNCIFCHLLWIALKPYEAAGLQVRWIPVGFLHEDSAAKAAAILKGGESALERCQQHFNVQTESGGIEGIAITPALRAKLSSNLQLMRQAGADGTPGIFYKDAAGHVRSQDGMPSMSELPKITGLPPQPETDPQLARFSQ